MATSESSLKQKNVPYLWSYFGINLIIFLTLFFAIQLETFTHNLKTVFELRSFGICAAPLVLFILNGLLTPYQKAILVFWRFRNVLPGNRAFSFHAHKDGRIDSRNLALLYPNLPTIPVDQNRLWYKIYKSNSDDIAVVKSHRDFLLARDLTSMSFLFLIGIGIPCLTFVQQSIKWYYALFLLIQYFVMAILAKNHGNRFVRNVLANESIK